jgi:hypothetical protein
MNKLNKELSMIILLNIDIHEYSNVSLVCHKFNNILKSEWFIINWFDQMIINKKYKTKLEITLDVIKYFNKKLIDYCLITKKYDKIHCAICEASGYIGNLNSLKYLLSLVNHDYLKKWQTIDWATEHAIQNNRLDCVKYLCNYENGKYIVSYNYFLKKAKNKQFIQIEKYLLSCKNIAQKTIY